MIQEYKHYQNQLIFFSLENKFVLLAYKWWFIFSHDNWLLCTNRTQSNCHWYSWLTIVLKITRSHMTHICCNRGNSHLRSGIYLWMNEVQTYLPATKIESEFSPILMLWFYVIIFIVDGFWFNDSIRISIKYRTHNINKNKLLHWCPRRRLNAMNCRDWGIMSSLPSQQLHQIEPYLQFNSN